MSEQFDHLKTALADRYAIQEELGAGGMATVYLAEDLKHHRKVAVKVLRPDLAAAIGPERFLREIEVAAQLTHPHILPLHDSGDADGFLYYVMPYIEGQSLREKLANEGELPIAEAVNILREVVDALATAHKHGVAIRTTRYDYSSNLIAAPASCCGGWVTRTVTPAAGRTLSGCSERARGAKALRPSPSNPSPNSGSARCTKRKADSMKRSRRTDISWNTGRTRIRKCSLWWQRRGRGSGRL